MFHVDWEKEDYPSGGIQDVVVYQMLRERNSLLYASLKQRNQLDDFCKALWIEINSHFVNVLKDVEKMYPREPNEDWLQRWQNNERLLRISREINNKWVDTLDVWDSKNWEKYVKFD